MVKDIFIPAWFVIHTRSRFENVVHDGLAKKSVEVFSPKIRVPSKRRDRKLIISVPLFPGYVFVRTDMNPREQLEILKTAGVVRFVGNSSGPLAVPAENIESLKIMVAGDNPVATGSRFKKGERVVVVAGPFTGVIGSFSKYRGKGRVIVNIEALGQFAAVEINEEDIEPASAVFA